MPLLRRPEWQVLPPLFPAPPTRRTPRIVAMAERGATVRRLHALWAGATGPTMHAFELPRLDQTELEARL